ncbi:MAG: nitroreductase [Pseudomonadota bacterium]|nr:nitroreductase [Pseudomonadota bacterium]
MNVIEALNQRKSTRAFLQQDVDKAVIEEILDAARHAPSGANTQPWQVAVVTGEKKRKLEQRLEAAFRDGIAAKADYVYYPTAWSEPYKSRRVACGLQLYSALHIEREDKQRRRDQWVANYRAFDAPVVLFFFMDAGLQTGSFLDYGMFLQSLMLAAVDKGLASCPQAALAEYPLIVKQELGYPENSILICGMALGYENRDAAINHYRVPRVEVPAFAQFFE